jgi:hypothetical protein
MLVKFGNNSFNFLFDLKINACSDEGDVFKNENDMKRDKKAR